MQRKLGKRHSFKLEKIQDKESQRISLCKRKKGLIKKCIELREEIVGQIRVLGGNEPLLKLLKMLDVQVEGLAEAVAVPVSAASPLQLGVNKGINVGQSASLQLDSA